MSSNDLNAILESQREAEEAAASRAREVQEQILIALQAILEELRTRRT